MQTSIWHKLHIDPVLLGLICITMLAGLAILYSASDANTGVLLRQLVRLTVAFVVMLITAQISPRRYAAWAPWLFCVSLFLLIVVLLIGYTGKGATRWVNLGLFRFQPSEMMKLAMPMLLAWYLHNKYLPPSKKVLLASSIILLVPVLLTAKQPDLGTALIIASTGVWVLLLAGIGWRLLTGIAVTGLACLPIFWHFLHDYQRNRILTFLNPERDPLGTGYHIIQSKIAIGSGGLIGKGWFNGTQSHLQFLPEHATDFIFAVCGEEFGLLGCLVLIALFIGIVARCLYISTQAQDTFSRLFAGSLGLTFFISAFINIGMVTGILPVVGIPLPLVSYGGTSLVTIMAGFGIIMSVYTHRYLIKR